MCQKSVQVVVRAMMQLFDDRLGTIWAVSKIAQRQEASREIDLEALLQVTRYIFATKDRGLRLRAGNKVASETLVRLRGYADSGFAAHRNVRSQYCYGFDIVDREECDESAPMDVGTKTGLINMKSSMSTTVDLCTAECEGSTLVFVTTTHNEVTHTQLNRMYLECRPSYQLHIIRSLLISYTCSVGKYQAS